MCKFKAVTESANENRLLNSLRHIFPPVTVITSLPGSANHSGVRALLLSKWHAQSLDFFSKRTAGRWKCFIIFQVFICELPRKTAFLFIEDFKTTLQPIAVEANCLSLYVLLSSFLFKENAKAWTLAMFLTQRLDFAWRRWL